MLFSASVSAAGPTTVTDTVSVSFTEAGGISLLGITSAAVQLEANESGVRITPGARYQVTVSGDEANGGRLRYTVHGQQVRMKITVRALTPIEADSMSVQLISDPAASGGEGARGSAAAGTVYLGDGARDLITDIRDCYTGTGALNGPLLRYSLHGDPGFEIGDVELEYTLTPAD